MIRGYKSLSQHLGGALSANALAVRMHRGQLPLSVSWDRGALAFDPVEVSALREHLLESPRKVGDLKDQ